MRRWLASETSLKILALVLAMFTWFFVKAVTSDSRTVEGVPLEIKVHPGLAVTETSAKALSVTVRGTTEDLRLASRNEFFAVIDLSYEEKPGNVQTAIKPDAIRHPRRVQVVAIDPTNIVVQIEKIAK